MLSRAIVPPQNLAPDGAVVRIQVVEGYVDKVEWPAALDALSRLLHRLHRQIMADRPANIRTLERYLLLASDLPGLKFTATLKPSPTHPSASTLIVEVVEKPIDHRPHRQSRHAGARARGSISARATRQQHAAARTRPSRSPGRARCQLEELQYFAGQLPPGADQRGPDRLRQRELRLRASPAREMLRSLDYRTAQHLVEAGLELSGDPLAREEPDAHRPRLHDRRRRSDQLGAPFTRDRLRGFRLKADADWADSFLGINQVNVTFSQGIHGLGCTENADRSALPPRRASTNAGRVDFTKIEATFSRAAAAVRPTSRRSVAAYGAIRLHAAARLRSNAAMAGASSAAPIDPSQMLGDHCWAALGELRYDMPTAVQAV